LNSKEFENFDFIQSLIKIIRVQIKCVNFRDVTALPLIKISSRDLGVRRLQGQESVQGTSIGKKKIKIVGAKKSLGVRVAYPSAASQGRTYDALLMRSRGRNTFAMHMVGQKERQFGI
jgi:hypothetical protein